MNEQNLIHINDRPDSKEIHSKGGKAAAESRRRKKELRERLAALIESNAVSPDSVQALAAVGQNSGSYYDAIAAALVAGAVKGNPQHIKLVAELMGDTGAERRADNADRRDERMLTLKEQQMKNTGSLDAIPPLHIRFQGGKPVVTGGSPNQLVIVDDLRD